MIPRLSWRMVQARMSKGDTTGIGLSVFAHAMLFAGLLMFSRNMAVARDAARVGAGRSCND
jgi:hypothetical protein